MQPRADGYEDDAMMTPPALAREVISFGPFSLVTSERLLTREGAPVELSARALDILVALLSRPNEVVSKNDLLAQVWPDATVEEGSLRFHIVNLRKALGDGKDGARYITTLTGRGYCFVAPISRSSDQGQVLQGQALAAAAVSFPHANLPGSLIGYLRDKRIFLILDTCEHLIEAVAALASTIFMAAPQVHILATSRETLQVEGEHVYRLDPLACPPDDAGLTAAVAQTFSAPKLFVERAVASGAHLDFSDAEAAIVVSICRKLDGVALAIELAARRVEAYGLHQTAALLDHRLTLLWVGPRTAPPRQKTLHATLDWSYGLLSQTERQVLRRLAIFVGHFTLDAALAIVTSATLDQAGVFGAIDSLVAKSMVETRPVGAMMRYRLLDTTRAYALEMSIDDTDLADLAVRHATYYRRWLEQAGTEWS